MPEAVVVMTALALAVHSRLNVSQSIIFGAGAGASIEAQGPMSCRHAHQGACGLAGEACGDREC